MTTDNHLHFYVGSYTDKPSTSNGIAHITLDPNTGRLFRQEDLASLRNPTYLAVSEHGIYSFSEIPQQEGAALYFNSSMGNIYLPIAGDYPCHIDVKAPHLAVANYGSGNVSVYQLDEAGRPIQLITELFEQGHGSHTERQQSPHAHQVTFLQQSNHLVFVDLGTDRVHFYHYENSEEPQSFTHKQSVIMPAGSGPRHLVFNKSETRAYVVCELSETLIVLTQNNGLWDISYECELLTDKANGEAASAIRLSPDEKFIYVSCRSQNLISIFNVSGDTPSRLNAFDCLGDHPRDFILSSDGTWLIVTNLFSDNIVSFRRNRITGEVEPTGHQYNIDAPICIVEAF
ncbi:lactonase family protein [Photobacterium gaetbulicola]|uniref:6-phosphogluconolactonase n=1 Tax=Photobacterium gaetbulicola Gung47 TaxID=658445 RepID=A0A0C5WL03_9GAMM|nr:lactonase family protein [Photobacterium gaetbulicola]AJR05739.1 6-phosphogluconolactonase [Photobacterium gaetbulicola Gung47]PSU14705.1 lactonase family protein [Photobacterium gaetbulicola]